MVEEIASRQQRDLFGQEYTKVLAKETKKEFVPKKRDLKSRINSYIDFYDRAFTKTDIEEIRASAGQTSLSNFKEVSKDKARNLDYWNAMFNQKKGGDNLGREIFERFVKNENVGQNSIGWLIVQKGKRVNFNNKLYKGGMRLPKMYFTRRTN